MPEFTLIQKIFLYGVPILFAITVHEVAHGWVANKLGDPTARMLGRLTLNPIKHIDPVGTLLIPAVLILLHSPFLFGWAKPVPITPQNFAKPRTGMSWVAAAGPVSNLIMAVIWTAVAWAAV
ncbi:MAG TPA: site-2 protease family protein, partial [Gammaproteobacteria bacterium]|nr:site-2 protease family protein [Gammaproteobacteria bacterium]